MFDLIYHCDSYPAIGNGHLSRGIMILNKLLAKNANLRVAIHGRFSDSAMVFKKEFLNSSVFEINDIEPIKSKLTVIDTMFDPMNEGYINADLCLKFKKNTKKLALLQGVLGTITVPDSVDFIINHMPDLTIQSDNSCSQYLGFDYVPVTEDFLHSGTSNGKNLLIILGSNSEQTGPEAILSAIRDISINQFKVEMILSPHFPKENLESLRDKFEGMDLALYQNVPSFLPYFKRAFSVICTYGHTTYEALSYHLPTFLVAYKSFQNSYANYLASKDLVVNLGFLDKLNREKLLLLKSKELHKSLSLNSRGVFRKSGINNITNLLLNEMKHV